MGFFRKGKRQQFNTVAAGAIPLPPPPSNVVNHYHQPSRAGTIITLSGVAIGLLIFGWFALVFLAEQAGIKQPERVVANGLFWVGVIIFAGLVFVLAARLILNDIFEHGERMKDKEIQLRRVALLDAQTTIDPSRYNEADFELARVVLACMMVAYGWQEKNGRAEFNGRWRPWSLRSAMETGATIGVKLTQDRANSISGWLYEHGVITSPDNGQITKDFPNLSSVRAMLDNEYGKPIIVNLSPDVRSNKGYVHI